MTEVNHAIERALRYIKEAYIAGIIFGSFNAVFVIVATAEGDKDQFLRLLDSLFCYVMSYGIYRKSRICTVLLFLYCIAFIISGFILPTSAVAFLVFVLAFVVARGVLGTFRYHKLKPKLLGVEN
ncbi:hypothetical protein L0244_08985 [bacterium]|nr:hypothetical protein [bacterium]